jgi:hypothetical protein
MKTFKDLLGTNLPFCIDYGDITYHYYPISSTLYAIEYSGSIAMIIDVSMGEINFSIAERTFDYFDPTSLDTKENLSCTCDFYSVIMVSGCRCGGK